MLELNKLYNMDCMEGMAQYPDDYFDLAIVDPPYGVGSVTYMPCERLKGQSGFIDKYDIVVATLNMQNRAKLLTKVAHPQSTGNLKFGDENVAPPPAYFKELFRVSKNQIIWGGNYFILPPSRGYLIWRKTTVSESFSMAMCEYAWMSFNANAKVFECAPQGTAKDKRIHPTQKPVKLYDWILKNYAKAGDKILDTHAGSASSFIAAHNAGLDYVGFELDADYYKAAIERINKACEGKFAP